MGFDRVNNSRYPFLLGVCILLCILLVCNWWSYSTQNYELLKQVDEISNSLKICSSDRNKCTEEMENLNTNLGKFKIQLSQQKSFCDKAIERQEKDLTICKSELESLKNLDASKNESLKTLRSDLFQKKEEIKELQEKLDVAKQKLMPSEAINEHEIKIKDEISENKQEG